MNFETLFNGFFTLLHWILFLIGALWASIKIGDAVEEWRLRRMPPLKPHVRRWYCGDCCIYWGTGVRKCRRCKKPGTEVAQLNAVFGTAKNFEIFH